MMKDDKTMTDTTQKTRPTQHAKQQSPEWLKMIDPEVMIYEFFAGGWLKGTERLLVFPELLISRLLMVL